MLIAPTGDVLPRLVLIELDANMQFADLELVTSQFGGSLQPHFDTILGHLDADSTRYFAIAHAGCWSECPDMDPPVLAEAEALRELALKRGFVMIGHFAEFWEPYAVEVDQLDLVSWPPGFPPLRR